ncbi:5,6-dimethylbenzimidazole synthase [Lentisphaera marina]|uniref:5,6-dimethylbenzimidazole synthase n=1 Tax=Lentisphaera marina TaxID=1111041 RepID=UPI0023670B48|nr:5,6-dimethylbenzimidazole synthase [Lentisphaera marina]MDD7986783.1 5,6-dimethylbenzimidazole synthase [Lentisphaera marina]
MSFREVEKESFYRLLEARRDVRSGFLDKEIPEKILKRILSAAHHAPSVGFLQPWDFLIIRSDEIKQKIKSNFLAVKEREAQFFTGEMKKLYEQLKLEGILEAPINLCVTCDLKRDESNQLGRSEQNQMDVYSTVCAIQNMWLAARVEGIGMGWVSILEESHIREVLKLPESRKLIGYFCLGYVDEFKNQPELESKGWNKRLDLDDIIRYDTW